MNKKKSPWDGITPEERARRIAKAAATRESRAYKAGQAANGAKRWLGIGRVDRSEIARAAALIRWGKLTPEERAAATLKARSACAKGAKKKSS